MLNGLYGSPYVLAYDYGIPVSKVWLSDPVVFDCMAIEDSASG
ncbi:MAG: hypothetical protein AAF497_04835 [Planctomycetota bacterium]